MFTQRRIKSFMHRPLSQKWYNGYGLPVYRHVPAAGPGETPVQAQAPQAAPTVPQPLVNQVQHTHTEIQEVLTSTRMERMYSPRALQEQLLKNVSHDAPQSIGELSSLMQSYGGHLEQGDLVGSLARTYDQLSVNDAAKASEFLYAISTIVGMPTSTRYQKAHPDVVALIAKKLMVQKLDTTFVEGNMGPVMVTIEDIAAVDLPFGNVGRATREIRTQLANEKVDRLLGNPEYAPYITSYADDLRRNYVKKSRAILRDPDLGFMPAGLIQELQTLPGLTFSALATRLEAVPDSIGLLRGIKGRIEDRMMGQLEGYKELMNNALAQEKLTMSPLLTAEQITTRCDIVPGSVIQLTNAEGQSALVEIMSIENRLNSEYVPPVNEEGIVRLRAGGSTERFSAEQFMQMWNYQKGKVIQKTPLDRAAFFGQFEVDDQVRKSSQIFMHIDEKTIFPLRGAQDQYVRFGGRNLSWTELQAFLAIKGVKLDQVKFTTKLSDEDKKKTDKEPKKPRKRFWDVWKSSFATPRQLVHMAENVFNYFKEEFEGAEKEQGLSLLHEILPKGIFRDEIEAKLANMQDKSMQDKLGVIKKRTSIQVAESGYLVFKRARQGKHVDDSLLKAYLLALLDKGGELYYGPYLGPLKNSFFIYEALGGKIGDPNYKELLEAERKQQKNPNLPHPSEWRCIMNFMDKDKKRFGPIFYDTYDSTYNASKDPQMGKQKAQLEDVNYNDTFRFLNVNEVYHQRNWRWVQGIESAIAREQGVDTVFEVFFHALAFGQNLEDKQRKQLKNFGIPSHMPFLGYFADTVKTKQGMDVMTQIIQHLASLDKYKGKTDIKGINLKTFDYSTFCIPGSMTPEQGDQGLRDSMKKRREVLTGIYNTMGKDIFDMMAGKNTYKILTLGAVDPKKKSVFDAHKKLIEDNLKEYEVGAYDETTHKYFNTFFANPTDRSKAGMMNQLLRPTQLSGSFKLAGDVKAESFMTELITQMEHMHGIINNPDALDPLTKEKYSGPERAVLAQHLAGIEKQLYLWMFRMDNGTYDIFLKDPFGYSARLRGVGMRLSNSYAEMQAQLKTMFSAAATEEPQAA